MESEQLELKSRPIDPAISKLLQYLLSQYSERPHGSINESLLMGQLRGELQKVCDIVEEEPFKMCPYLTKQKWLFISLFFVVVMVTGILSPLATIIISTIGNILYWFIYDVQFSLTEFLLPGNQSINLLGQINCSSHEKCTNERTVLIVSHTSDLRKDNGILYHLTGAVVHFSMFILTLFILVGYIIGLAYNNYILIPIGSILSTIVLFFSMSLYIEGKKNKVSGLATALCSIQLAQRLKEENNSILESINMAFLITTSASERHEGVRAFLRRHRKDERFDPKRTIVICLDELDDSETLCCYRKEGVLFKQYSETIINVIKDAGENEGIVVSCVSNRIHKPFTSASEFSSSYLGVVPITAKCRSVKRKFREEKEQKTKQDGSVICVHDDQMLCIENCTALLLKVCKLMDCSADGPEREMKENLNNLKNFTERKNTPLADVPIEL